MVTQTRPQQATQRVLPDYEPERFWDERYTSLDLTRSGHRDLPQAYNRWLYRRKQAVLKRALQRAGWSGTGHRLLEVGAGTGAYIDFWQRLGVASITGLDISGTAAAHVQQRYPQHRFVKRDVTEPGLSAECGTAFDLVTALDVMYHVVDDDKLQIALVNVAQVLRPGGLFAIHDQFLHRTTEHHGYIRWRSLADWQRLLDTAGFEVVSREPIFFCMIQTNDCATPAGAARMDSLWERSYRLISRWPALLGAVNYSLDSLLGLFLREGPSMELMLVRRKGTSDNNTLA